MVRSIGMFPIGSNLVGTQKKNFFLVYLKF